MIIIIISFYVKNLFCITFSFMVGVNINLVNIFMSRILLTNLYSLFLPLFYTLVTWINNYLNVV